MKRLARLAVLLGAIGAGAYFLRASPRDVVLVYGLGDREVSSLEVEIARGDARVRRAELHPGAGPAGSVRHPVRLTDGDYRVRIRVAPRGRPPEVVERSITVSESTTIVLPLPPG